MISSSQAVHLLPLCFEVDSFGTDLAALGHLDVLKAVVEVLQSSAADVAGCPGSDNIKEPSINMLTWGRFVKDVINARTSAGKTPLMLACEKGYSLSHDVLLGAYGIYRPR